MCLLLSISVRSSEVSLSRTSFYSFIRVSARARALPHLRARTNNKEEISKEGNILQSLKLGGQREEIVIGDAAAGITSSRQ